MDRSLAVIGIGAVTPVGLSSLETCAALRASISGVAASNVVLQTADWEQALLASTPLRPRASDSRPVGRTLALAQFALEECLAISGLDERRTALLVGVPELHRLERWKQFYEEDLHDTLRAHLLNRFHPSSRILSYGNATAIVGLLQAREMLNAGVVDACLVGGADSLLNSADLDVLEHTWRLHRSGEGNGMVPGEGATFLAVVQGANATAISSSPVLGQIVGIGVDREDTATSQIEGGHPTGQGMVRALRAALQDAALHESSIGLRVTDLNGERYRAMDSMLTVSRQYRTHREGLPLWHPAESVGECGAAVGGLLVQIACQALSREYSPSPTVVCEASSDSGLRAACLVRGAKHAK